MSTSSAHSQRFIEFTTGADASVTVMLILALIAASAPVFGAALCVAPFVFYLVMTLSNRQQWAGV